MGKAAIKISDGHQEQSTENEDCTGHECSGLVQVLLDVQALPYRGVLKKIETVPEWHQQRSQNSRY
jgi:hypothetical protein